MFIDKKNSSRIYTTDGIELLFGGQKAQAASDSSNICLFIFVPAALDFRRRIEASRTETHITP